jgi:hypothetical protein
VSTGASATGAGASAAGAAAGAAATARAAGATRDAGAAERRVARSAPGSGAGFRTDSGGGAGGGVVCTTGACGANSMVGEAAGGGAGVGAGAALGAGAGVIVGGVTVSCAPAGMAEARQSSLDDPVVCHSRRPTAIRLLWSQALRSVVRFGGPVVQRQRIGIGPDPFDTPASGSYIARFTTVFGTWHAGGAAGRTNGRLLVARTLEAAISVRKCAAFRVRTASALQRRG